MVAHPAPELTVELEAEPGVDKERVDRFLARRLTDHTRSRMVDWIKSGRVTVDGAVVRASHALRAGARVVVHMPPPPETTAVPQDIPLTVVYEDAHLVVIDKPAGLVVHPGPGHPDGTLVNALLGRFGRLSPVGAPTRPGIVHRIDAGTTGLLVSALDEATHNGLAKQFSAHTVERRYEALVWDHGLDDAGTARTQYGRHANDRRRFTGQGSHDKHAVTHWTVAQRLGPCALVEMRLETGRTHQIRVHLSEAGCPLLGDPMYGRKRRIERPVELRHMGFELGLQRQALHAATLGFEHPITGATLQFEAALPADFAGVLAKLREAYT